MTIYLKLTSFCVHLFSRAKKNLISWVLIFASDKFLNISRVLIFARMTSFSKFRETWNFVLIWNLLWWKYCVHNHMQIRMRHSNHNFVPWKLKEENMANKNIAFSAAVRGFFVYKSIWKLEEGEKLMCYYEMATRLCFQSKFATAIDTAMVAERRRFF